MVAEHALVLLEKPFVDQEVDPRQKEHCFLSDFDVLVQQESPQAVHLLLQKLPQPAVLIQQLLLQQNPEQGVVGLFLIFVEMKNEVLEQFFQHLWLFADFLHEFRLGAGVVVGLEQNC